MNNIPRDTTKSPKFKQLKKFADGYVAKNIITGEIRAKTFISRLGNSKITGPAKVWPELCIQSGYRKDYIDSLTKEKKSEIIQKLVEKGWRVIAVNLKEVELPNIIEINDVKDLDKHITLPKWIRRIVQLFFCKNHKWQMFSMKDGPTAIGCTFCGLNKAYYNLLRK